VTPPEVKTPIVPTTETPPPIVKTPQIPELLPTPPVIPEDRSLTKLITVTTPKPKDPGIVPPPPTDILTGEGRGSHRHATYSSLYTDKHRSRNIAHAGQVSLSADEIGLYNVPVEAVGNGADRKHPSAMVPAHPFTLASWKYEIPGKEVMIGHINYNHNPGPLEKLDQLGIHNGHRDKVTITGADGKKTTYEFDHNKTIDPNENKDWVSKVFAPGNPELKELVLVSCHGKFDRYTRHYADKFVVYMHEVKEKDSKVKTTGSSNTTNTSDGQTVEVKFGDVPNPLTPIDKPVVSPSFAPGKESVVVPTTVTEQKTVIATNTPTGAERNTVAAKEEKPVVTATTQTRTLTHSVEVLTNGSQTLANYYSKPFNVGVGLSGAKPTFVELGKTVPIVDNGRDYATSTLTGGLAFGSRYDASKTLSITDHGPYLSNQLYYDHKLGHLGSSNYTSLFASGGLSYQPDSRYNLQAYGALGLRQNIGNFSIYGGVGEYTANHLSPTMSPFAGASYKVNRSTSVNANWDGRSWTAGVGFHF
jgi:hypothetical protein